MDGDRKYTVLHTKETGGNAGGKVVVGLAEPFPRQLTEDTVESV